MQPTRRTWTTVIIGVVLSGTAPILASPVPVVGAAIVFGWLIARQLMAVRQFQTTTDATTISVDPAVSSVQVGTEIPITLSVERPSAAAETKQTITLDLPVAADHIDQPNRQLTLAVGETQATKTVLVSIPTAGRMMFPQPKWELLDAQGGFIESFTRGPTPTVTIEAETLQDIYVGRGGSEQSAYGQHSSEGTGAGLVPAELREYLGSDPADRIDWKATARLPDTYVREFEAESDRETTLIVDHRSHTGQEAEDGTQLAYLREVALSITSNAESVGDPLGLITVGDGGLTTTIAPTRTQIGYARIREQLLDIEPTPSESPSSSVELQHPAAARQLATQLADDETAFGTILRQFAETVPAYVEQFETDPLYGAVEYIRSTTQSTQLTIILTTDVNRQQLRETVRAATSGTGAVLVFLTPQILFDTTGLADIEAAYRRYRSFEEFRSDLEQFSSVVAYEVGPRDRISTLRSSLENEAATQRATSGGNI